MEKLTTSYLGLNLNSPLILSSSGLTKKMSNLQIAEESGAGAIVLKSIFEEQITHETNVAMEQSIEYPEAADYIRNYSKHNSINDYINFIKEAKSSVKIPIIASINCTTDAEWPEFTKKIEDAGADALELNMNVSPFDANISSQDIENKYFNIFEQVRNNTDLNIACKISKNFTALPHFIKQLNMRGAKTFVLFNRFFEPMINIHKEEIASSSILSDEKELKASLRWVAIIKGLMPDVEISASTGVHNANGVIQQILAGADTVQLCSVFYRKGVKELKNIKDELVNWMDKKSYNSIDDFKAKLSYKNIDNPNMYERFQFIKHFANIE